MRPISLGDIFNTEPRYKRMKNKNMQINPVFADRFTKNYGFQTEAIIKTPFLDEPRYKRLEKRKISTSPYKILDAPGVYDDYYLNILDWNSNDLISIGLAEELYLYDVEKKEVINLASFDTNQYISSIKSNKSTVATGISNGEIVLYDILTKKEIRKIKEHETRVTSLDWNDSILSSGSRTGLIVNFDIRDFKIVNKWNKHTHEVCGLKWSPNKKFLASGANDNKLLIWQLGSVSPRFQFDDHSSAVKALDWCPWKSNILVSGGGSNDKTIKFWDMATGQCERNLSITSQVCGIHFIEKYKEMITAHGFSENNICLWKESNFRLISSFGKHDNRVLYTALNPDQSTLISLAADENLKFWKINEKKEMKKIVENDMICFR